MRMPGFSAEASLDKFDYPYRVTYVAKISTNYVQPQSIPNGEGPCGLICKICLWTRNPFACLACLTCYPF